MLRGRKLVFVAAVALLAAVQPGVGTTPAQAELGFCEDPADDTTLTGGLAEGPGKLDIRGLLHFNDNDQILWSVVMDDPFGTDDVDQITWDLDYDGDNTFEGSILVDGDPLEATVRDDSFNTVATGTVIFEEETDRLVVGLERDVLDDLGDPGLTYEYLVTTLESSLVGEYREDTAGPCAHNLKLDTLSVVLASSTVTAGGTVSGTAGRFGPGSEAMVFIRSDPVLLGTTVVNAEGLTTFSFTVPASTTPGTHTIEVHGVDANGDAVVASAPVTVLAQAASPTPLVSPGLPGTGLPNNGANTLRQTGYGLLLVAIGLLMLAFVTARRMRPAILRDDRDDQLSS